MQVVKRDGKLEEFDPAKIEVAIKKANIQAKKGDKISKADIEEIVNEVTAKCELKKKVKVEEIQDLIVPELYKKSPKLAQSFERYRYKREVGRTGSSEFLSAIKEKLEALKKQQYEIKPEYTEEELDEFNNPEEEHWYDDDEDVDYDQYDEFYDN